MFWSIVSAWIDPVTRAKFIILGSDYQEKLLELIDADQLPVEYGGTCDGSQCGTAVGKPAGTPCIKLHDQARGQMGGNHSRQKIALVLIPTHTARIFWSSISDAFTMSQGKCENIV